MIRFYVLEVVEIKVASIVEDNLALRVPCHKGKGRHHIYKTYLVGHLVVLYVPLLHLLVVLGVLEKEAEQLDADQERC